MKYLHIIIVSFIMFGGLCFLGGGGYYKKYFCEKQKICETESRWIKVEIPVTMPKGSCGVLSFWMKINEDVWEDTGPISYESCIEEDLVQNTNPIRSW